VWPDIPGHATHSVGVRGARPNPSMVSQNAQHLSAQVLAPAGKGRVIRLPRATPPDRRGRLVPMQVTQSDGITAHIIDRDMRVAMKMRQRHATGGVLPILSPSSARQAAAMQYTSVNKSASGPDRAREYKSNSHNDA